MTRRSRWTVLLAVVAATLAVLSVGPALAAPHPAQGQWVATDHVDGSSLRLTVTGSADNARVVLRDDRATVACPIAASAVVARGRGAWVADELDAELRITCVGEPDPPNVTLTFVHDPGTDTITEGCDPADPAAPCDTYVRR